MHRRTLCAQGGPDGRKSGAPLAPEIVPSSAFAFDDQAAVDRYHEGGEGFLYSRYENPSVARAERFLAGLEGAERAAMFASGMAAISTLVLTLAGSGDRIAAQRELYGGTVGLFSRVLPEMGIDVVWLSREQIERLDADTIRGCRLLYLETPVNPTLRLVDLSCAAAAARKASVPTVVDSTFATPALQRPLELGIDLVVHSATKYLGGHGDLLGGALAGRAELVDRVALRRRSLGGTLDAFSAFLLHRGMRTLAVRMEAHCRGAAEVAESLDGHPRVERVFYPGLAGHPDRELALSQMEGHGGGMVSFAVDGGERAACEVHDRLRLFVRAGTLGGVESLVSIPARMSHRHVDATTRERMGVTGNLLRLSVGLELPADLIDDLNQALGSL